ncbi:MAG TPA: glycine zipper 2TM domain-containing protein [Usitatibacter sp.]|nr:glycine zipper 2TM domain-containing protein [Usitatibacter sp.]
MNRARRILAAAVAAFAGTLFMADASAACKECGSVVNLRKIEKEGEASGAGAVIGGIAGGVLGHQIGSGRGNTVATVAGAAGGAYAGHEIEKNRNKTVTYQVVVKMEDGRTRYFDYREPTSFHMGDPVKIVDHRLTHR